MFEAVGERKMEIVDVVVAPEDQQDFVALATAFLKSRSQIKVLKERSEELRDRLLDFIERFGYEDAGSQTLELPSPIEGVGKMIRQRRASNSKIDAEAAEKLLRSRGLWDRCTKEVRVPDRDAIMVALYEEVLTDEDLKVIYPTVENYALVTRK